MFGSEMPDLRSRDEELHGEGKQTKQNIETGGHSPASKAGHWRNCLLGLTIHRSPFFSADTHDRRKNSQIILTI